MPSISHKLIKQLVNNKTHDLALSIECLEFGQECANVHYE